MTFQEVPLLGNIKGRTYEFFSTLLASPSTSLSPLSMPSWLEGSPSKRSRSA